MATSNQIRDFARVGAAIRLGRLAEETKLILTAFPELRDPKRRRAIVLGVHAYQVEQPAAHDVRKPNTRRRRRLTAVEKKRISSRMKDYWAERRRKES